MLQTRKSFLDVAIVTLCVASVCLNIIIEGFGSWISTAAVCFFAGISVARMFCGGGFEDDNP